VRERVGALRRSKTTLINIVGGLVEATAGTVHFRGEVISGRAAHAIATRGIARTFQLVRPFLGMTVEENIRVGALFGRAPAPSGRRTRLARVEEVLAFLDLTKRRSDPVRIFSVSRRPRPRAWSRPASAAAAEAPGGRPQNAARPSATPGPRTDVRCPHRSARKGRG
jgi:ABC-type lipopolysaccharide export system ATPase subunit